MRVLEPRYSKELGGRVIMTQKYLVSCQLEIGCFSRNLFIIERSYLEVIVIL